MHSLDNLEQNLDNSEHGLSCFEEVYQQYQPLIYGTLKKFAIFQEQEDFLQEARLALWEAYVRFKPERGEFPAYAKRYVRGRVLSYLTKLNKHRECYAFSQWTAADQEGGLEWEDEGAERAFAECELLDLLLEAGQLLSTREKIILEEHFLLERPLRELAEREQVSLETVKTWRKRALKKLRQSLSPLLQERDI